MASRLLTDWQSGKGSVAFDCLMRISSLASYSLDLEEVLPKTLAGIAEVLAVDRLTVLQDDGGTVVVRSTWASSDGLSSVLWNQGYAREQFPNLCPRETLRVDEGAQQPDRSNALLPYLVASNPVTALLVPLTVDNVAIGRFDIVRSASEPFSPWEQRFVEACAKILSLTVRNGLEYARVAWLAEHDPLTGIGNRRRFDSALSREINRAQRYGRPLTLLLIDLDDFKEANTQLGLSGGDEILRRIANVLSSGARQGVDVSCRIGGDEFALILPEINEAAAQELVQRLLKEVVRATAPLWPMRFSYSISTYPTTTAEDLRKSADARLLDAKTRKKRSVAPNLGLVQ